MDINFPLILVILVFVSGAIALIDKLFFAKRRREKNKAEPSVVEYSRSFFPVLFVVLVLRSFLVEPFQIPSTSMVPTLEVGDFILVNKFTYGIRLPVVRTKVFDINDPKRGDVMVFFPPHEKRYFIKRVIGLPGDTIRYVDNQLFINNQAVENQFIATDTDKNIDPREACVVFGHEYQLFDEMIEGKTHKMRKCTTAMASKGDRTWEVPQGHYFMVGDNRDNSADSRAWGFVPEENIVGKAFAIWMHWEGFSSLPSFSRVGGIK